MFGELTALTGAVYYAYNSRLDVVFLIDGTFTSSEFSTVRQFLVTFADRFYALSTLTRFAVIQFAQSVATTFGFTRYSSNADLRSALGSLVQSPTGGVRDLGAALNYAWTDIFFNQTRSNSAWVRAVCLQYLLRFKNANTVCFEPERTSFIRSLSTEF